MSKFTLIAGPCVIESEENVMLVAEKVKEIAEGYSNVKVVEGMKLIPHFPDYFLDNLHPNALGCETYARNLVKAIEEIGF